VKSQTVCCISFLLPLVPNQLDRANYQARRRLNGAIADLKVLSKSLNNITAWWICIEAALKASEQGDPDLRPGKDRLRVRGLKKSREEIKGDYIQYRDKVGDYVASQRLNGLMIGR
jgi:hypothetical protein